MTVDLREYPGPHYTTCGGSNSQSCFHPPCKCPCHAWARHQAAAPAAEVGGGVSPAPSPGVLTPAIAAAVLWKFGQPGGLEPGHFIKALLEAISVADLSNRAKLRQAFPGHVEAWGIGANERDGVERLQSIAAGLSDVDGRVVPDPDPAVDSGVGGAAGYRAPGTTLGSGA